MASSSLAPPSTSSATTKTMNSPSATSSDAVSDGGHSSPSSSNVDSPLVSFDNNSFDSSDPLNFFLNSNAVGSCPASINDSSADDSHSSTSPSSHDSPMGDWSSSDAVPSKDSVDPLWHQSDLSLFSLDNFGSSGGMGHPLGFDSMLFSNDPFFSMNSTSTNVGSNGPTDLPSFTFHLAPDAASNLNIPAAEANNRRHSITSSSSGVSSAISQLAQASPSSTSDTASSVQRPVSQQVTSSDDQLMDELATRARQLVGLTMALPSGEKTTSHSGNGQYQQQQNQQQQASVSQIDSTSQPVPSNCSHEPASASPAPVPPPTRTKTSHTTIERRYRTNLNARIQALRAAVPALRVLEVKHGNRVGNLSLKAGTRRVGVDPDAQPGQEDVIDERGYIDGVKVARKGSKANVLGKAVEYIHVLKRREMRLKREQEGLKALIRSLVGGPELVQQWEMMWRERFGGPEKDEVDAADAEADDDNDDGEDDDDADYKEFDEMGAPSGKKRKRAKVDPTSSVKGKEKKAVESTPPNYPPTMQPIPIMPSQTFLTAANTAMMSEPFQPEKRKRGRPRKVPLPPVTMSSGVVQNNLETPVSGQLFQQQHAVSTSNEMGMQVDPTAILQSELPSLPRRQPGQQYLLAAFAFFSFFNSPLGYSSAPSRSTSEQATHPYTHSGSVLGDVRPEVALTAWRGARSSSLVFGWRDLLQVTHLAVSFLLLLSVISPWFPRLARYIPRTLQPILGIPVTHVGPDHASSSSPSSDVEITNEEEKSDVVMRTALLSALSKGHSLSTKMEAEMLREALGLESGVFGLISSLTRHMSLPSKGRSRYGLERRMLEQKAFLRFAELVVLDADASMMTRIQTYLYAFKFLSIFSASVKDITTLALVIRPLWRSKSTSLWTLARSRAQGKSACSPHICKAYEVYLLESMTVDEASRRLEGITTSDRANAEITPLPRDFGNEVDAEESTGLLAILAKQAIRNVVRTHTESIFCQSVSGDACLANNGSDDDGALERSIHRVIEAGRSLDMRTAKLADAFERACNPASANDVSDEMLEDYERSSYGNSGDASGTDTELFALCQAILLYRRIFASTLVNTDVNSRTSAVCRTVGAEPHGSSLSHMPSPPPSPSRRDAMLHLVFRRCLDSSAFDNGDLLEDARDRVVDMLTAESSAWPKRLKYS